MSEFLNSWGGKRGCFIPFLLGLVFVSGAGSLASCASMAELPVAAGGMPQDAPKRPQTVLAYPAVHDMPPPRKAAVLTETERKKVETDLAAMREQQARRAESSKANPE